MDSWDMILIYTLFQKLDNKAKKKWVLHISNKELTLHQMYTFLEHRWNSLESVSTKPKSNKQRQSRDRKIHILM
jgi:hypothetical protein